MSPALNVKDVAERYGISPAAVYRMVVEKRIPYFRIGPRLVRFRPEALDQWERDNTITACSSSEDAGTSSGTKMENATASARAHLITVSRSGT
jgi:excisionase family DNA binding protein